MHSGLNRVCAQPVASDVTAEPMAFHLSVFTDRKWKWAS